MEGCNCDAHKAIELEIKTIKEALARKTELLDEVFGRLGTLEKSDIEGKGRLLALCERVEELTKTIEKWMIFAEKLFWKIVGAGGVGIIFTGSIVAYMIQHLMK